MPRHEQDLGLAGRVAGVVGRVNRFNPGARIAGAVAGRVGVSHDSLLGKALNVNQQHHASIHEAMASHMANSRAGKALAHAAGALSSRDPIIRGLAKHAQARGLVGHGTTAAMALGLDRKAAGLAGVIEGMRKKSAHNTLAGKVKNAQFEAKHKRVHGRFA